MTILKARPSLRDLECQAVLDLQQSMKGGSPAPEFVAAIRAAEAAYIREEPSHDPLIQKAQILAWAGLGCIELHFLAKALLLLETYRKEAENEGERSISGKAIRLIKIIIDVP